MQALSRTDAVVGSVVVLAAVSEAVARDAGSTGRLAAEGASALVLGALALRRSRPLLVLVLITVAAMGGIVATRLLWPDAPEDGGVWLLAVMLAAYSVGAYRRGPVVLAGVLLPFAVVVLADGTSDGWSRLNGILFVTLFVGALPTGVGRAVRARRHRLGLLRERQARLVEAQRARRESAVLTERLRATARVHGTLVTGVHALAALGDDPAAVERGARDLLSRTREEVLALTTPAEPATAVERPEVDHLPAVRTSAQPWVVVAGGAVVLGLSLEATRALPLDAPDGLAVFGALLVGLPLAFAWWRPGAAVVLTWVAASAYSRVLVPLDGTVSGAGVAFVTAFAVGALCRRTWAVVGLVVCWVGQVVGVRGTDPLGEGAFILLGWLGGMVVQEAARLVEETRVTTDRLQEEEGALAERAVMEERLRLARDVHDSIGHTLTVLALQAGAARRLAATDPARSREVMGTVTAVARDGIPAETDLPALLERVRATGLSVEAHLEDLSLLGREQQETAFHIVREALTNVLRHAPGSRVEVGVARRDGTAVVRVDNSPSAAAGEHPGSGRGLCGIRERVLALGGHVAWGPSAEGGFSLRAELPEEGVATVATTPRPVEVLG